LAYTHTSVLLEELAPKAPDGPVDLDWLLGHLDKRSFGFLLLLLGLLVIVPGVASIASLMVIFPSLEMVLGRTRSSFPQFLSKRQFDFKRFKRFTKWWPVVSSEPRYCFWRCRPSGHCHW